MNILETKVVDKVDNRIYGLRPEIIFSFIITFIIIVVVAVIVHQATKRDPLEKPKGAALLLEIIVNMIEGYIDSILNGRLKGMYPYLISVTIFIFISNISGLFGFDPPTSYVGVTLALGMIAVGSVHVLAMKQNGFKGYWKRYIDPIPILLPLNIMGNISPLVSISLRLAINIMSGSIILSMVYTVTGMVSSALLGGLGPIASQINIIGPIITPALHFYFDLFSGFIQTLVFLTLSTIYLSLELED